MKKLFLFISITTLALGAFAQARLTTTEYQKTIAPGIESEFPFPEKTVEKAIQDKLEKKGYKGKDNKGFLVFKGVRMDELGPETYDLYFKTDKKRKSDNSTVTLLISRGYEKFIGDSTDSHGVIENGKAFLNGLVETVAAYDLELQVTEQDDVVKKADKKMAGLIEDAADLKKKKEKIEKDIEDNLRKQEEQKKEAEKQRQIGTTLKGKRKQ